jgi:cell wall assembly regulator SMI1
MNKKLLIFGMLLLSFGMLGICTVPSFPQGAADSGQPADEKKRGKLIRLLMVQDESKVDALLAKAKSEGKITVQQTANIKNIWVKHHAQFAQGSPLGRLLQVQDIIKVKAALDKAAGNKRITQQQADRAMELWQKMHNEYLIK